MNIRHSLSNYVDAGGAMSRFFIPKNTLKPNIEYKLILNVKVPGASEGMNSVSLRTCAFPQGGICTTTPEEGELSLTRQLGARAGNVKMAFSAFDISLAWGC